MELCLEYSGCCRDRALQADLVDKLCTLWDRVGKYPNQAGVAFARYADTPLEGNIMVLPPPDRGDGDEDGIATCAIRLFGVRLPLYDLREGVKLLELIFARSDDPALDGRLVHVWDRAQAARFGRHASVRTADWALSTPYVGVNFYLEEWLFTFLAWLKAHYISDLQCFGNVWPVARDEAILAMERDAAFFALADRLEREIGAWHAAEHGDASTSEATR